MESTTPTRWEDWNDAGGTIVRIEGPFLYVEFICDASQRRYLSGCLLTEYFTQVTSGDAKPLREEIARDLGAATAAAIEAAIRERIKA